MISTKTCSKCGETKLLDEFSRDKSRKDSRQVYCKKCSNKQNRKYRQEHKEYSKEWYKETGREKQGSISMYENKLCSLYLGIVIAERLVRQLFKDVEMMPNGFPGYDIICNKGKKINVKAACITLVNKKYSRWAFFINRNTIPDFFILVAFDNLTDLNPLHLWMIPGEEINHQGGISIYTSTIHKWDKWKRDIKDAQLCCAKMKGT